MTELELSVLDALQSIHNNVLDKIMIFFTMLGEIGVLWILLGIVLLFFKKYRKNGWILLFSLLVGVLLANVLLKNIVARIRPYDVNTAVQLLIRPPSDWSFPSGHATASFAAAAALLYTDKRWGIAAYITAFLIAFSRMYLYVHYPTDILGGIAVGTVSAIIVIQVSKRTNWKQTLSRFRSFRSSK